MKSQMYGHEKQRFSIRKYSFGAASVLLGATLVLGGQVASADEQVTVESQPATTQTATSTSTEVATTIDSTATASASTETSTAASSTDTKSSVATDTTSTVSQEGSSAISTTSQASTSETVVSQVASESQEVASTASETVASSEVATSEVAQSTVASEAVSLDLSSETATTSADNAASLLAESKVVTATPVHAATGPAAMPSQGDYVYTQRTEIKNTPKLSAKTEFYANAGDKVYYDQVVTSDGYDWISYKSYSGVRRYAALPNQTLAPSGNDDKEDKKTTSLPASGQYTFNKQTDVKNEATQSAPVQFVFEKGDKVTYDKVLENDGHQWLSYVAYSGTRRYADLGVTSQAQKPAENKVTGTLNITNKTANGFDVVVSNVNDTSGIVTVKVPVWTTKGDQDDIIWYDAAKQTNGDYRVAVNINDHKNERGDYNVHLYYIENSGKTVGVAATKTTVVEKSTISNLPAQGSYTFSQEVDVKNQPKMSAKTEFTFAKGESISYDKVLDADNHQWISYTSYSGTRRYIPITSTATKDVRTGNISFQDQSNGDFNVIISNVSDSNGISTVKVPVWTVKNDQDDIIWYDAAKQTDGTYKVNVKLSDHKNERGNYNVHLYYVESNGQMAGLAATTHTVAESKAVPITGKITVENQSSQGFDVVISNVSSPQQIAEILVPVWSTKGDQDDIIWNHASKQADGTYKTRVNISDHKNERGEYNIHLYYGLTNGKTVGVTTATTTVAESKATRTGQISFQDQSNGDFTVIVSNVADSNGVATVKVPVWTVKNDQDDIIWYDAAKQTDGTYKVNVKLSDHKNERGNYNVHLYYVENNGQITGIAATTHTVAEPKSVPTTGKINIENKSSQGFDVVISDISSAQAISEMLVPVWTEKGDQDDITWNHASKQSDGTYKTRVNISDHKNECGDYNVHLYYALANGQMVGVTTAKTTVEAPKGDVVTGNISFENSSSRGFDVIISNVSDTKGIQQVKVPVWSTQGGQDDIIWYDATKQNNGDYKVSVQVSDHKTNRGEYNVHLYYVQNDGSMRGVAAVRTTVPEPSASEKKEVTYNGSYYSIQGKYDEIVIVNKKYPMSANYNPGENPTAKAAFVRLRDDMIKQGYNVGYSYSGFRTYAYQQSLYQNYVNRDGQAAADRYSARPGYSEHQTGLVFDLTDKAGNLLEDSAAATWLQNNAQNYGFVVRYQPGKEASTGYMPEAWHIRYIGKEAKEVHDSGLSLEEYYGFEGGDYRSAAPSTSTPTNQAATIPSSGSYTFTKHSSIKAEPRMTSPELAYYDAGNCVNYDSVLQADGHQWISYIGYSGIRRYVAID